MKRLLLSTLVCLFAISSCLAQVDFRIMVGPKFSNARTYTDFNGNPLDTKMYIGVDVAGQVFFRADKKLQIYGGLGLGTVGVISISDREDFSPVPSPFTENLEQYIIKNTTIDAELPVGVNLFFQQSLNGLYFDVSLKPSYILWQLTKTTREETGGLREISKSTNSLEYAKRFNTNIKIGIGYQFSKFQNFNIMIYSETRSLQFRQRRVNYFSSAFGISCGFRI